MATKAERKASIVKAWAEAAIDPNLIEERGPSGLSMWRLGPAVCVIETIRHDAPLRVKIVARQRVMANLTGRCPQCGAVTSVERLEMSHERECTVPAQIDDEHLV